MSLSLRGREIRRGWTNDDTDKFNLDFRNPVSPLCAMALATSLFFNNPHVPS